jgi:hypothetical protein
MSTSSSTVGIVSLAAIVSLGVGFGIGFSMNKSSSAGLDGNNNTAPMAKELSEKSIEDLGVQLSDIMLPKEEYDKLGGAILQSAMGLFMAQAQGAGITVDEKAGNELKTRIDTKYTRKYFTDMNAVSMKELTKDDLVAILAFYGTSSGGKFLKLSPKIIEATMTSVQNDLSQWLPVTVNEVIAKLKGNGKAPEAAPSDGAVPGGEVKPAEEKQGSNS